MEYNFVTYSQTDGRYNGITLSKNDRFSISKQAKSMLKTERIKVLIDKEKKAILLIPSDKGYKVPIAVGYLKGIGMPLGRYKFIEKEGDGYVFINN